jgi:hypothetical protein
MLRTLVVGRNILRFAACGAGTYCEEISIVRHLAGVEADGWSLHRICLFVTCRQIPAAPARRQPQTEMPNRASILELHAACLARFGDSGMIEAVRVMNTGSMAINGQNSKGDARCALSGRRPLSKRSS